MLDVIVKLVNAIRSRGLANRQFREFLESMQSEYSDILYSSKGGLAQDASSSEFGS